MALRSLPWVKRVIGLCRRASSAKRAEKAQAVDLATCDPQTALAEADLVVLASPLGQFERLFRLAAQYAPPGCVVTDAGSTKTTICRLARTLLPPHLPFVGSHPIAGSEQSGVEAARADLFAGHSCVICPDKRSAPQTVAVVRKMWTDVGMKVTAMSPARHDRILAQVSHLPHLAASLLVLNATAKERLLCGPGFLDTTRVAGGDPDLWTDILRHNAAEVSASLRRLMQKMERFRLLLDHQRWPAVRKQLNQAKVNRDLLMQGKK